MRRAVQRAVVTGLRAVLYAVTAIGGGLTRLCTVSGVGMVIDVVLTVIALFAQIVIDRAVPTEFFITDGTFSGGMGASPAVLDGALEASVLAKFIRIVTFFVRIDAVVAADVGVVDGIAGCAVRVAGACRFNAAGRGAAVAIGGVTVIALFVPFAHTVAAASCLRFGRLEAACFVADPSVFGLAVFASVFGLWIGIVARLAWIKFSVPAGFNPCAGLAWFFAFVPFFDGQAVGHAAVTAFVVFVIAGFAEFDLPVAAVLGGQNLDSAIFGPGVAVFELTCR